ncbi:hypothetical protein QOZ80_7AG0553340 [Eleusine coracana subsp. coracana]|nr:hypothetical protein QOZ80_7AG0553340 [Eleusine coracana subsp. coracana]
MSMQAFLTDLDDKMLRGGSAMAKNLVSKVREVAHEVENIIDTANILRRQSDPKIFMGGAIFKYVCFPVHLSHLHKIGEMIDSTTARMKTIFEDFERHNIVATAIAEERIFSTEDDAIQHWRLVDPILGKDVVVIGFDQQIEQIKSDLLDRWNMYLSVFSIVGPGGAGKSTMANKVYGLGQVKRHFHVCAWITVSQTFEASDLLKEMVRRIIMVRQDETFDRENQNEVKKMLYDFLLNRRYLIVLDDVWGVNDWDIIRDAFPENKNGSRVILTTRNEAVARQPNARKKIYRPKLLNEEESTELLLKAAIPEYILDGRSSNNDPAITGQNLDDLKKVGKDLAKKCCGLPLALVVLGGHLSRNVDIVEWRRLKSSVDWHTLINTDSVIGAILDLSYYDMPSHLRSCFMYTTAFPEDSRIGVRILTKLWVAEGFIPIVRGHTREEVAAGYINELAQRCMVQVEKRNRSGAILQIKMHDVLRDWGIGRARREGVVKDCHDADDMEAQYSEEMVKPYRVALHGFLEREVGTSMRKLRTLLDFALSSVNKRSSNPLHILHHLRVLYLGGSHNKRVRLPEEISRMKFLRYIGLGGSGKYHLPSSIGNLLCLETLDGPEAQVDEVPGSLWKIPTLRHVHISMVKTWSVPAAISSQSMVHVKVSSLVDYPSDQTGNAKKLTEATQQRLSEKRKPNLSYCFGMKYVHSFVEQMEIVGRCKGENLFLADLTNFEEMKGIVALKVCCTNLLSNEQKLLQLAWMEIQVLEIGERSYTGSAITFPSGSFPWLLRLVLHDLAVEEWKIEVGCMINLMELTLCKCPNLCYLPEGLSMLPRIQKVKLIAMPAGCYQGSTVLRELGSKGCEAFVSSDEKYFEHLDMP